jgi:hypothetical protein
MSPIDEFSRRSTSLGRERTATHLLTHNNWCPSPHFSTRGSNETGVRSIDTSGVVQDDFFLIQHGWRDWELAAQVIKRLLAKGCTPSRIADIMDYIKERRWVNQTPKAKVI